MGSEGPEYGNNRDPAEKMREDHDLLDSWELIDHQDVNYTFNSSHGKDEERALPPRRRVVRIVGRDGALNYGADEECTSGGTGLPGGGCHPA